MVAISDDDKSFLETAQEFYWEGSLPLLAGLGGLIGLGLITACCCCRDIRRAVRTLFVAAMRWMDGCVCDW